MSAKLTALYNDPWYSQGHCGVTKARNWSHSLILSNTDLQTVTMATEQIAIDAELTQLNLSQLGLYVPVVSYAGQIRAATFIIILVFDKKKTKCNYLFLGNIYIIKRHTYIL